MILTIFSPLTFKQIDAMKSKGRLLSLTRILTSSEVPNKKDSDKEVSETKLLTEICDNFSSVEDVDPDFYENIEHKRGWPLFSKVFMVSALKDDGIEDLRVCSFSLYRIYKLDF